MSAIFDPAIVWSLLPYVSGSLLAAAILGVVAGVMGPLIAARDMAFAVHGAAELAFAGAAAALLILGPASVAYGSVLGSVLAAVTFALLGRRAQDRNAAIGVVLAFGLGLGVLFLSLYKGRSANKFGLLVGQIVAVDTNQLVFMAVVGAVVLATVTIIWRPLLFVSVDPQVALARGVPGRTLSVVFMVLLGLTVSMAVQIVGALLVLSLLITPTAAAARVTASPLWVTVLSVVFALVSALGGILLSLTPGIPISPFVTSISFVIYLVCRVLGRHRVRAGG